MLEHFVSKAVGCGVAGLPKHAPARTRVSATRGAVRFDPTPCQARPRLHQCPGERTSQAKRKARWQDTHARVAQRHRRLKEQEPACTAQYRWRAGREATMSR
jgi:hypothetical protein